jgi:hypothetical protein
VTAVWRPLAPDELDHELLWSALAVVSAACAAAVLVTFGLPPVRCAFKSITGLPCPTCGATRAFLALVQGGWRESLALNPLVVPAVLGGTVYVPYALAVSLFRRPRLRLRLSARDRQRARVLVGAVVAGVWTYLIVVGR